jgi:hypothetical protein
MTHTPTPWIWDGDPFSPTIHAPQSQTCICELDTNDQRQANAQFIIRACNSHDALLEACKTIVFQVSQGAVLERDACIAFARAAIALAFLGQAKKEGNLESLTEEESKHCDAMMMAFHHDPLKEQPS